MLNTPKKFLGDETKCFLCSKKVIKKDKIYIFGKTTVDLRGLINFSIDINLSPDKSSEKSSLFVCKQICYRALNKVLEAKLENLKSVIKTRYLEVNQD